MLAANVTKTVLAEQAGAGEPLDLAATFVEHRKLIDSLSKGYPSKSLKLFVAMPMLISDRGLSESWAYPLATLPVGQYRFVIDRIGLLPAHAMC